MVRSEDSPFIAQTGLSQKQQFLKDAEFHHRQKFLAKEAEFDQAFKDGATTGNLALFTAQQLGISEFEFNFHNAGEDGAPNPRLTEAIELLRLIREDNFNLGTEVMKTYSGSSGIKYDDVKQSRMETLAVHKKRFAQLMNSLKKEYEPEVNPTTTTMKRPRPTTGGIGF